MEFNCGKFNKNMLKIFNYTNEAGLFIMWNHFTIGLRFLFTAQPKSMPHISLVLYSGSANVENSQYKHINIHMMCVYAFMSGRCLGRASLPMGCNMTNGGGSYMPLNGTKYGKSLNLLSFLGNM